MTEPTASLVAVAESFSRHDFASVYPRLAPDARWNNIGGDNHTGNNAVITACQSAVSYFTGIETAAVELRRTTAAGTRVIVEAVGTYVDNDGTSRVASCDIYDFENDQLTTITSYNVELPE